MVPSNPIPAVIIGVHRSTVVEMAAVFEGTPYQLAAILDLSESPKQYQYSAQNLGAVLNALHPRPQVLVTGTAIERIVSEVRGVWEEYTARALKAGSKDGRAVYVPLTDFHSADGPPPLGTVEFLMDRIDAVFR